MRAFLHFLWGYFLVNKIYKLALYSVEGFRFRYPNGSRGKSGGIPSDPVRSREDRVNLHINTKTYPTFPGRVAHFACCVVRFTEPTRSHQSLIVLFGGPLVLHFAAQSITARL